MKRLLAGLVLVAAACGPGGPELENGTPNAAPNNVNQTPNNATTNAESPPTLDEVTIGFAEGAAVAADFVTGLQGDGDQLETEMRDGGSDVANTRVRDGFENGVSGNSVVTEPTCVTYTWGDGLVATVVFDGCIAEQTGETIDGSVTATVTLRPVTFGLVLDDLAVGTTTFNGSIDLAFGDAGGINADLQFDTSEGSTTLTLADFSISMPEAGGVVLDGAGSVNSTSFDATDVTFAQGDCLPTSGTLEFEDGGNPVTATFLATTPTTGAVEVTWPPLISSPTEIEVFPPCGSL